MDGVSPPQQQISRTYSMLVGFLPRSDLNLASSSSVSTLAARSNWVGAALMVLTASFILVKTGRDALYFQDEGLFDLPYAYFGIMLASAPMALGTLELMRRLGARTARLVLPMIVAAALLASKTGSGSFKMVTSK